jgi:isoquinoline 1-oxidoreductase subunit beta
MAETLSTGVDVTRRGFLKGAGGLTFCLAVGVDSIQLVSASAARTAGPASITAWVRIAPTGTVTIYSPGAEMGQGSMTSLPLIVAEEMDADWSKVEIEWAPADPQLYGYKTGGEPAMAIVGSRAVMLYYDDLRIAGAQVRKVLLQNAGAKWNVTVADLRTEPGFVVHPASARRMSYGEIAAFATVPSPLPAVDKSELKKPSEFRLIGKRIPRRDTLAKATGKAQYAIDVHLPGLVHATSKHSPVHGGEPESWNDEAIRAMKGVVATVRLADGVAVVADTLPHAMAARTALQVKWKEGRAQGFNSEKALADTYVKIHGDPGAKAQTLDSKGDVHSALAGAARKFRAEYRSDYGYHAQMEPLNAVARFNADASHVEIWEGSQAPDWASRAVARAVDFKPAQVTHHQCYMGGGFGRRSIGDCAAEAARIARAVKKPVKLVWTRDEDLAHGMFRPQSFQCLEAGLDESGKVTGWSHCVVGDGGSLLSSGMRTPYYDLPNQHLEVRGVEHGVRLKHWRSVGHVFNLFAIESFVDEMAAGAGMDPVEFRYQRMSLTPRARALFERVVAMSGWNEKRPAGRALGISVSERSRSLGAGVVEISLDRNSGKIRAHNAWLAVDGGLVVLPDAARANIESGVVYGLSSVLFERVTVKDGIVEQSNFHDYQLLRMGDMPEKIQVEFIESGAPPSGLGEIGNPWVSAAVANAFYRLTGKRLRHMPFTPARVLEVLRA